MQSPTSTERLKDPTTPHFFFGLWERALPGALAPFVVEYERPLTTKESVPDAERAARTLVAKVRAVPRSANASLAAALNVASALRLFIVLVSVTAQLYLSFEE